MTVRSKCRYSGCAVPVPRGHTLATSAPPVALQYVDVFAHRGHFLERGTPGRSGWKGRGMSGEFVRVACRCTAAARSAALHGLRLRRVAICPIQGREWMITLDTSTQRTWGLRRFLQQMAADNRGTGAANPALKVVPMATPGSASSGTTGNVHHVDYIIAYGRSHPVSATGIHSPPGVPPAMEGGI